MKARSQTLVLVLGIRRNRIRYSRSRSPDDEVGSRQNQASSRRSRSPRGAKRSRHDRDHHYPARANQDPRQFRVHYEDSRYDSHRSRYSYDDDDRPPARSSGSALRYDDRDRSRNYDRQRERSREREQDDYPDKRRRNRSRSPYRSPRPGRDRADPRQRRDDDRSKRPQDRDNTRSSKNNHLGSNNQQYSQNNMPSKRRLLSGETRGTSKDDTESTKRGLDQGTGGNSSVSISEPEQDIPEEQPLDVEAEIERRRRRREELLSRSRGPTPLLAQALHASEKTAPSSPSHTRSSTPGITDVNTPQSAVSSPASPAQVLQEGMSPAEFEIASDQELINKHGKVVGDVDEDGPSAADYDPTVDMREDEKRDELRQGHVGPHGEIIPSDQKAAIAPSDQMQITENAAAIDDDLDMFADDFDEEKFAAPKPTDPLPGATEDGMAAPADGGGILDGDDKDGYYKIRIGEIMNGRYQVQTTLGKGMFSGVARAVDITNKQLVAIKMMRNNDALRKGGFVEIAILQKLNAADPENRKHIVKFERHFEHKGHLCLAFENLSLNLREVLRKFGNNVGINLGATRAYAHQMFVALAHMRKCTIIHADLKPDNILVNEARNVLKICDLGTAIDRSDAVTAHNEITPYLISRFYRAPEIILGIPYDYAVDMWSIGCTLYELYTGKILFTGDSNNQMLKAIMEIRGKFSPKLYKRGQLWPMHFDEMGNFVSIELDKALGKTNVRTLAVVKPTRDLRTRLTAASGGMNDAEARELNHFVDLLERCLALNPDKRITPSEALKHPFFLKPVGSAR
ncbi:kinase-like domain-containing protein [Xylariales sp. PMI_506]|nr:kinase-like domain-containing protein [Xylariales sp. PMI_506]